MISAGRIPSPESWLKRGIASSRIFSKVSLLGGGDDAGELYSDGIDLTVPLAG
jgi:hypothetical protein